MGNPLVLLLSQRTGSQADDLGHRAILNSIEDRQSFEPLGLEWPDIEGGLVVDLVIPADHLGHRALLDDLGDALGKDRLKNGFILVRCALRLFSGRLQGLPGGDLILD